MSKYWTCCRKLEDEDAIQQYKTQWRRTINCWIHEYCRWCSKWVRKVKYFMLVPRILESYKLYDDVIQNILYLSGNIHRQQHVILKAIDTRYQNQATAITFITVLFNVGLTHMFDLSSSCTLKIASKWLLPMTPSFWKSSLWENAFLKIQWKIAAMVLADAALNQEHGFLL